MPERNKSMSAQQYNSASVGEKLDLLVKGSSVLTDHKAHIHRTAPNVLESPSLCLPAELRISIWRHAYGEKIILVSEHWCHSYFVAYDAVHDEEDLAITVPFPMLP